MYLLMLLATFLASIQGYNLSFRQDYDRDIMRKKAAAIISEFSTQHTVVQRVVRDSRSQGYATGVMGYLPGDVFFGDTDDTSLPKGDGSNDKILDLFVYQPAEPTSNPQTPKNLFTMRTDFYEYQNNKEGKILTQTDKNRMRANLVPYGKSLRSKNEMISRIVCPDNDKLYKNEAEQCKPQRAECSSFDEFGNCSEYNQNSSVTKTCCGNRTAYLITYKKLDARLKNKITGEISYDFVRALERHGYGENLGVVFWNEALHSWVFQGKIRLLLVYGKDKEEWEAMATHKDHTYPVSEQERNTWIMPNKVFTKNFFIDAQNSSGVNLCESNGCLVKITTMM